MTELYIDGHLIVLGKDFSIDYYAKNPFFTRVGEYTYDIDIDLKVPANSRIYKHIQRSHNAFRPIDRRAILISYGKIIIVGTEIILSIEEYKAKIQVVSGNSELNYLSGGDKKIRDLDFGTIQVNTTIAMATLSGHFPEYNFVCVPIRVTHDNGTTYVFDNEIEITIGDDVLFYKSGTYLSPQPYLLYYVEKLVSILGYTLESNVLRNDPKWCKLFLVNGQKTSQFAKMLPDWTINEFITEIEKFFNCVFLVNNASKIINIQSISTFYHESDISYIDKVVDDTEKKYDVSENLYITYDKVEYNFPSIDSYKYDAIDKSILDICTVKYFNSKNEIPYDSLKNEYNQMVLYHTKDYNLDFISYSSREGSYIAKLVNRFSSVVNKESDNVASLNLIPSEIYTAYFAPDNVNDDYLVTVPFARNVDTANNSDSPQGLNEIIKDGPADNGVPDKIFIAFYLGITYMFTDPNTHHYLYRFPMASADTFCENAFVIHDDPTLTLTLVGEYGMNKTVYSGMFNVDTSIEYVIRFMAKNIMDPKFIFIIDNKKFYCKELHYTIGPDGINKICEGTFYPM